MLNVNPWEIVVKFASTRLIAADIKGMVAFYEMVTGLSADWLAPVFAEIDTPAATLAIGSAETVALWKEGSAEPGADKLEIEVRHPHHRSSLLDRQLLILRDSLAKPAQLLDQLFRLDRDDFGIATHALWKRRIDSIVKRRAQVSKISVHLMMMTSALMALTST